MPTNVVSSLQLNSSTNNVFQIAVSTRDQKLIYTKDNVLLHNPTITIEPDRRDTITTNKWRAIFKEYTTLISFLSSSHFTYTAFRHQQQQCNTTFVYFQPYSDAATTTTYPHSNWACMLCMTMQNKLKDSDFLF